MYFLHCTLKISRPRIDVRFFVLFFDYVNIPKSGILTYIGNENVGYNFEMFILKLAPKFSPQYHRRRKTWSEHHAIWNWFCEFPREIQNHLWNSILICVEKIVALQSHQTQYPEQKLIAGW